MRLVSLNTWKSEGDYPLRVQAMAEGLAALFADVIALQEDLRTLDGRTHTARALGFALTMQLTWLPARAKPRALNSRQTLSTSGLAVLSRQPVLEQRVLVLPQDPRDGERVAQCVRLDGPLGDWWLVNLHLTHLSDRADLRHSQLVTVQDALGTFTQDRPVILCGDFNASPEAAEMAPWLQPFGPLSDVFGNQPKTTHLGPGAQPLNLDHIFWFTTPGMRPPPVGDVSVQLRRPASNGVMASDHFAVCADLF